MLTIDTQMKCSEAIVRQTDTENIMDEGRRSFKENKNIIILVLRKGHFKFLGYRRKGGLENLTQISKDILKPRVTGK